MCAAPSFIARSEPRPYGCISGGLRSTPPGLTSFASRQLQRPQVPGLSVLIFDRITGPVSFIREPSRKGTKNYEGQIPLNDEGDLPWQRIWAAANYQ